MILTTPLYDGCCRTWTAFIVVLLSYSALVVGITSSAASDTSIISATLSSLPSSSSPSPSTTELLDTASPVIPVTTLQPTTITATSTLIISPSSTTSTTSSISTVVPSNYPMPRVFDSTLGVHFTSTACPSFFATFLADPVFNACAPFSLLLSTSAAFFKAQQSPYSILPYVIDATCAAPNATCSAAMDNLATQIQLPSTCGPDLSLGNTIPGEALLGFRNYNMMRIAGCQRNLVTNQYCFAEAAAQSEPSDLYFYYLPTGTSLPSGTNPNCNNCTQKLLALYSQFASNTSLLIAKTYPPARSLTSISCGPSFAPPVAEVKSTSWASHLLAHQNLLPSLTTFVVALLSICV